MNNKSKATFVLWVLFGINLMNFFDRQILGAVGETIRDEWKLSDTALGTLGTAFIVLYAAVGLPLGRLTDRITRTWILSAGVFVWSLFTAISGVAQNFWQLVVVRLGVGVGEAACAPAATSLIGDLFPATKRGKALSVFMLGLPLGIALSFAASSWLTARWGWRSAFYIAAVPGVILAVIALTIREPARGASETHAVAGAKREGSPYRLVLSIPTMRWLIVSGALHNFNMYSIGAFLSPLLQRYHHGSKFQAGLIGMVTYGLGGIPGLFLGGILGDAMIKRRQDGRLLVAAIAVLVATPFLYFAIAQPAGSLTSFAVLMFVGCATMYAYYSTVYSTIQDVIEPSLRGTAMALYFFAMYVLGAALGPFGTGYLSDYFKIGAARAAGVTETTFAALAPYAGGGLRSALFVLPLFAFLLALVLFAGSRTVTKDMAKLHDWMRESGSKTAASEQAAAQSAK